MSRLNPNKARAQNLSRPNYGVKAGESLASIALKRYGDARFAKLILTINRGEISLVKDGPDSQACLILGQVIMLPTERELDVYCRNFFTESSKTKFNLSFFARPAMPSDSRKLDAELDFQPKEATSILRQRRLYDNSTNLDESAMSHTRPAPTVHQWGKATMADGPETHVSTNQYQKLPRPNLQNSHCQTPVSNQANQNSFRLAEDHELFFAKGTLEVTSLSHYCRVLYFSANTGAEDMVVKLQIYDHSAWQTIAAYSISEGTVRRLANKADGSTEAVTLDLPREIARELSFRDFNRNWKNYSHVYFNEKEKMRLTEMTTPAQRMLKVI